ncbi:MAG: hypothetical protein ACI9W2_001915 [Gammaproteobacteria bacterium]
MLDLYRCVKYWVTNMGTNPTGGLRVGRRLVLCAVLFVTCTVARAAPPMSEASLIDLACFEAARTSKEVNACFHLSSGVHERKLASLLRELDTTLDVSQANAIRALVGQWNRVTVRHCSWEREFYKDKRVARDVFASCISEHTAARIRRLKRFVCDDAGSAGPCDASQKY